MEQNTILRFAAISGALAVALGAFGAHGLEQLVEEQKVSAQDVSIYETAVKYQFYHTFALLGVAAASGMLNNRFKNLSVYAFITGIFVFSGSLYLLSLSEFLFGERLSWMGAITPIGGLFLITGWCLLFVAAKNK